MSERVTGVRATAALLGVAALAWVLSIERMGGMDAGPGTDLGGLGWFLGIWATMSAAMMLPSVLPAAQAVARLLPATRTLTFAAGYLLAWVAYGLAAYGALRLATAVETGSLSWDRNGPYAAGAVIVGAGIYELTPLKRRLLDRCRRPQEAVNRGAVRAGFANGVDCVGCCFGLMAVLYAVGVMSLFWMVVVALTIFAEKVMRGGLRLSRLVAVALVVLGIWVAAAPGTVPMLTEPQLQRGHVG